MKNYGNSQYKDAAIMTERKGIKMPIFLRKNSVFFQRQDRFKWCLQIDFVLSNIPSRQTSLRLDGVFDKRFEKSNQLTLDTLLLSSLHKRFVFKVLHIVVTPFFI